jgi:hypothetical protein
LPPPNQDRGPRPGGGNPSPLDRGPGSQGPGWSNPRINNPQPAPRQNVGGAQDGLLNRPKGNAYGGSVSNENRGSRREPISIGRAPVDIFKGSLGNQVLREERIRVNRGWRSGYYHYYPNWCDDFFYFGFYVFNPWSSISCYPSPWYYYPHLPGYINRRCVTVININLSPWFGTYYNWRRPAYQSYGYGQYYDYSALDYAVDDIQRMFERMDRRALQRLIPSRDRVAIFVDGQYSYSMDPYDFETFMLDAIEGTRTVRYEVVRVERRGREAEVKARHEYEDPWGRRTTVYHEYRLEDVRGYYVITRFGTSYYR